MGGGRAASPALMARLADALRHRGPDGEGRHAWRNMALVHRRLSIIDVAGGAQPIPDQTGKVQIVCNGEIYNFVPLQNDLERSGIPLKTRSDSEVALHLYKKYGLDFVTHMEGMYALGILDETTGDLVLARDPMGIKPLYISVIGAGLAFASEPAALVRAGWCAAEVDPAAWPSLFNRQYTGGLKTLFKGVTRVKPGEVLRIRDGQIVERREYPLPLEAAADMPEAEALDRLDALLTASVTSHLQSEVPYGAFLSGGIDSSVVVDKMVDVAGRVRTYTIGFSSATVADERAEAFRLAQALNTDHVAVDFTEKDFWDYLPTLGRVMDDLVADYAALPTLKLAERARQDVKVILSGEGGDEVFAGYGRYRRGGWLDFLRGRRFRGRGDTAGYKLLFKHDSIASWRDSEHQDRFGTEGFTRLQTYQARDMSDWLPDDLLLKVDRCLMAYGIEGRVPLLDSKFAAFAFALPDVLKIRGAHGKYLLKTWLARRHPDMKVWAGKRGFTVPIQAWLEERRPALLAYLAAHGGVDQVVHRRDLKAWLEKPLDRRGAKLLFTLVCYALWHDVHIQDRITPDTWATPA